MRKPSMVGLAAALGAARLMRSTPTAGGTLLNGYADDIDRLLRPVDLP
jgi:hypothetical protein